MNLGLGGSVAAVARGLLSTFDAASIAVAIHDSETGRTLLWHLGRGDPAHARRTELGPSHHAAWLFPDAGRAWHATAGVNGDAAAIRVVEPGVWPLNRLRARLPAEFMRAQAFRT